MGIKNVLTKCKALLLSGALIISSVLPADIHVSAAGIDSEKTQRYFDMLSLGDVIPDGAIMTDTKLALPSTVQDASVTWTSGNTAVVENDGAVHMPGSSCSVELTATIKSGSVEIQKVFNVPVVPASGQKQYFEDNFIISSVHGANEQLPVTYGQGQIKWSGTGVSENGVIAEADSATDTKLTAEYTVNGSSTSKEFEVKILDKNASIMEAYTRLPLANDVYSPKLAYSMHLAIKNSSGEYTSLNDNCGLLYAKAEIATNQRLIPKNLKNPYVFYMPDGRYGIVAVRTDSSTKTTDINFANKDDASSKGHVLLFTTSDFIHYEELGLVSLNTNKTVSDVICDYDSSTKQYIIRWVDTEGNYYKSTTSDICSMSAVTEPGGVFTCNSEETNAEGSCERNCFYVIKEVADKVQSKFSKIYNTGVSLPEITVRGEADRATVENTKATLLYSDGSTAEKAVDWDLSSVDFTKDGTYYATGTINRAPSMMATDSTSMGVKRADPCIFYNEKDNNYYFIATDDSNGNATFGIRKSETIEGLKDAEESVILSVDDYDDVNMVVWAPEIHVIDGETYIFFAANPAGGWNVQCHIMKLIGDDMTKKESWDKPILFLGKNGKPLTEVGIVGGITLDMTTFCLNGQHYVCWTQRDFGVESGSLLCIGTIDPAEPWKLTSDPVVICRPDYGWDNNDDTPVDEGPYAIIRDKEIFITFSGSSVGATYCVGMLKADINADLLDANSWKKNNCPILYPRAVDGEAGPGHNSYTTDAAGNLVFVYHARPVDERGNVGSRNTGLRTVHFDVDGEPVLYMSGELELAYDYEEVTLKVVVNSKPATDNNNSQNTNQNNTGNNTVTTTPVPDNNTTAADVIGKTYTVKGYKYKVTDDTSVTVTGIVNKKAKSIKVSNTVAIEGKTYKVTAIGNKAFAGCSKAVSAVIGKNIKTIGKTAFGKCTNLKKITVKSSNIKKVGAGAFNNVSKKAVIKVPKKKLKQYKKLFAKKGCSRIR